MGAFEASSGRVLTLDTSSQNDLGNLQLYKCAQGCAASATVIGWTHGAVQHYYGEVS